MAEFRWTDEALRAATGAELRGAAPAAVTDIVTDSRRVEPGSLFVALVGERFDGHAFVGEAVAAGAAAVLVATEVDAGPVAVYRVPDTLRAYGELARWRRRAFDGPVVGVTGSCGKSTTKEILAAVLRARWRTLANEANLNNEIGLPATLLQLTSEHEAVVLELAMRGPGQIDYLARLAEPTVAVITNIGVSHVGLLGSREAIARAKGEVLDHLGPRGVAVLNADDPHLPGQAGRHAGRTLWYGLDQPAEVRAEAVELRGLRGSRFRLVTPEGRAEVSWSLPGRHMIANAMAAAAAGQACGLTLAEIVRGLTAAGRLPQRLEVVTLANGARVLNDSYNAAPDSVRAALAVLASEPARRRVVCLGDMLELGDLAAPEHLAVGHAAAAAEVVIGVGELGALIAAGARDAGCRRVYEVADAAAAGELLAKLLEPGDIALLKASRAVALERALAALEVES